MLRFRILNQPPNHMFANWHDKSALPSDIPLLNHRLLASEKAENTVREMLFGHGVFYYEMDANETVSANEVLKITQSFFAESESSKALMIRDDLPLRGYTPLKFENLSKLLGTGTDPDLCMKYSWVNGENVFPSEAFKNAWQVHYDKMAEVSKKLLRLIANVMQNDCTANTVDWDLLINGDARLRHLYYPMLPDQQNLSMAAHTDLTSLTLLHQTPAENGHIALEAKIGDEYIPLPAIKNTLVCIVGESLQHITNGKLRAVKHRVRHTAENNADRTSTVCFFLPHPDFNLQKFSGSEYSGLYQPGMQTFDDLLNVNSELYGQKKAN